MSWAPTPVDDGAPETPAADPVALILGEQLTDQMWMASATAPRTLQPTIGPSELGNDCDRALVYKLRGHRRVCHPDPLRTIFGSGLHGELQAMFTRVDGGAARYLIEHPISYRGVTGTADLYDARRQAVLDWKSSTKRKIGEIRRRGPQDKIRTQAHVYGAALAGQGFAVRTVALVFVPMDGALGDIYVWAEALDTAVADAAIDRLDRLRERAEDPDVGLADVTATPSKLCPWCAYHLPGSVNPETGCPGMTTPATSKE